MTAESVEAILARHRRVVVAPEAEPDLVGPVLAIAARCGVPVVQAPGIGGLACWPASTDLAIYSTPNRLGMVEAIPTGLESIVVVRPEARELLDGGVRTWVWTPGWDEATRSLRRPDPPSHGFGLALATDWLARRVRQRPGVVVPRNRGLFGRVPVCGLETADRLVPGVPGLPGVAVLDVPTDPGELAGLAARHGLSTTPGAVVLHHRRSVVDRLPIP